MLIFELNSIKMSKAEQGVGPSGEWEFTGSFAMQVTVCFEPQIPPQRRGFSAVQSHTEDSATGIIAWADDLINSHLAKHVLASTESCIPEKSPLYSVHRNTRDPQKVLWVEVAHE